jgi:hypothetical protein
VSSIIKNEKKRKSQRALTGRRLAFGVMAAAILTPGFACKVSEPARKDPVAPAIESAADYLCKSVRPDGSFVYLANVSPDVNVTERYNILRHAGAIYSLCMYYDWSGNREVLPLLQSTSKFLLDYAEPFPERSDCLGVWSKSELEGGDSPLHVKLGGNGLGLAALVDAHRILGDVIPLTTLRRIANGIRYMQKADGSFYSTYIPARGGRCDDWQSLYYPGEAALGLTMLYEIDPSPAWLEAAEDALAYLARERVGQGNLPPDHWALLATERLFSVVGSGQLKYPKSIYVNHAAQICASMIRNQILLTSYGSLIGGYSPDGRVTPSSTRLEGLIASVDVLPAEHPYRTSLERSIHWGIDFLLRAQIKDGRYRGAFPHAVALPREAFPDGTPDEHAAEIRVDYLQHALSALIRYHRTFIARSGTSVHDS